MNFCIVKVDKKLTDLYPDEYFVEFEVSWHFAISAQI